MTAGYRVILLDCPGWSKSDQVFFGSVGHGLDLDRVDTGQQWLEGVQRVVGQQRAKPHQHGQNQAAQGAAFEPTLQAWQRLGRGREVCHYL